MQTPSNIANRIALLILLLCAVPSFAQTRTFKWSDELCDYVGTYNSRKYSRTQISNTEKLFNDHGFSLQTSATVFRPEELSKLNIERLDAEYKKLFADLTDLDIVNTPYWQNQRKLKLAELKQVYDLSRITMLGQTNPNTLNELEGSQECKTKFAVPLIAGGDILLKAWRTLNEESRKNNSSPEAVRRRFESEYASSDRFKFAQVEVMTFGWWNCANLAIKYVEYEGTQEKEFKKLFVRIKRLPCAEP